MASIKFGSRIKEIRLHLCQTGAQSKGVREFINESYVKIKQNNPKFPFLIRECSGVQPRIWARYEKGQEKTLPLTDKNSNEVLEAVKDLSI